MDIRIANEQAREVLRYLVETGGIELTYDVPFAIAALDDEVRDRIDWHLLDGNKLRAIKELKEADPQLRLIEARDIIELYATARLEAAV